jgi:hypothetical protein
LYGILDGKVVSYLWAIVKLEHNARACSHDLTEYGDSMRGRLETRPEYRRRHIGSHTRAKMDKLLVELYGDQLKRVCGGALLTNAQMRKLVDKLTGGERIQRIRTRVNVTVILRNLFIYRLWEFDPATKERIGRTRTVVRLKVPDFLFSPRFKRLGFGPQSAPMSPVADPARKAEPAQS